VTYPQPPVIAAITAHAVPVQFDNSKRENAEVLARLHHIWTPDVRVLDESGAELYRWDGFLPPPEFMARALCGFAQAHLRRREFEAAEAIYVDVLRRFSTTYAAPEALYYLGVTRYRRDPESDELLTQWANLRSRYPMSEYRVKQSFKELASSS
jgi:hypothetical protein